MRRHTLGIRRAYPAHALTQMTALTQLRSNQGNSQRVYTSTTTAKTVSVAAAVSPFPHRCCAVDEAESVAAATTFYIVLDFGRLASLKATFTPLNPSLPLSILLPSFSSAFLYNKHQQQQQQ